MSRCFPPPAWPVSKRAVVSALKPSLVPTYALELPERDPWGHPLLVGISSDRRAYTLICTGSDGLPDRALPPVADHVLTFPATAYERDIVMSNDLFVLFPEGEAP